MKYLNVRQKTINRQHQGKCTTKPVDRITWSGNVGQPLLSTTLVCHKVFMGGIAMLKEIETMCGTNSMSSTHEV